MGGAVLDYEVTGVRDPSVWCNASMELCRGKSTASRAAALKFAFQQASHLNDASPSGNHQNGIVRGGAALVAPTLKWYATIRTQRFDLPKRL
jgi:hypothetical protein